jgi:hypothetical protein
MAASGNIHRTNNERSQIHLTDEEARPRTWLQTEVSDAGAQTGGKK